MSIASRHSSRLAWIDMIYGMLATITFLFMLSVLLIHPDEKHSGVEMKAEYIVRMSWPGGNLDDIDVHMLLPDKKHLHFRNKEIEYAFIDHDDLGVTGIWKKGTDGLDRVGEHQETISIRARVPGTYVVNIHVYRVNEGFAKYKSDPTLPYPVNVKLIKLNPKVVDIADVNVLMTQVGQQKTAFTFTVLDNGDVVVDTSADVPFLKLRDFQPGTDTPDMGIR